MTGTTVSLDFAKLRELMVAHDVETFSSAVLGAPYAVVKAHLYPSGRYKTFAIRKRNGQPRIIQEPRRELKKLQYRVLNYLEKMAPEAKACVHGFVDGRSIVSNALKHCNKKTRHVLNIDLEDFFPSISFYRVRGVLQKPPFGLSHPVATVIAQLCTKSGSLPQGAPTSPFLSNLVCRRLDNELMQLAKRHNSVYTRYADDITFSFSARIAESLPTNICSLDTGVTRLGRELTEIIHINGFKVNETKTRISSRRSRLEVTGLAINEFPNVRRSFIDSIRGALRAWKAYGYDAAEARWQSKTLDGTATGWHRQTRMGRAPELKDVMRGRLLYLRMVRGKNDTIYNRLAERFNALCESAEAASGKPFRLVPVEPIVLVSNHATDATLVVEWMGTYFEPGTGKPHFVGGQGTGFLYRGVGLVSCNHVLTATINLAGREQDVHMTSDDVVVEELKAIAPGVGEWPLSLTAWDDARDLAVLQLPATVKRRHLVPKDGSVLNHEPGHLIGYPNWSIGRTANVANAQVLNIYRSHGLQRFEVSVNIRRGNSGGPFVDQGFRLLGVAQKGSSQTSGNDECLTAAELDSWLRSRSLLT